MAHQLLLAYLRSMTSSGVLPPCRVRPIDIVIADPNDRFRFVHRCRCQPLLAGFEELLSIQALGNALAPSQRRGRLLSAQSVQHDADILSSSYSLRVIRRMSLMTFSADGFIPSIFCLIVAPAKGYDDPENLLS